MNYTFSDPNITTNGTFQVNGYTIKAPLFTPDELPYIIASTRRNAEMYFTDGHNAFDALRRSYEAWNDAFYYLRQQAIPILSGLTAFSEQTLTCFGLEPLGRLNFDVEQLSKLEQHLRHLIANGKYRSFTRWGNGYLKGYGTPRIAVFEPPQQIVQVMAGNVIGPTWLSAMLGAIAGAPQFIKLPSRDLASLMYYLQTLEEIDPAFRATIACGYYPGGNVVEDALLEIPSLVVAMGTDSTIESIAGKIAAVNPRSRLIPHGLKISFQVIGRAYALPEVAELVAWGVAAYDGNGCFSPANIYVETGGPLNPQQFAEAVAEAMGEIAAYIPPKRSLAVAERVTAYRQRQAQRRLLGERVQLIKSPGTDYTIIVDEEVPLLTPTCQERTVIIKPVEDVREVPGHVRHLAGNLQTVGLAVPTSELLEVADLLGEAGVTNIKIPGTEHTIDLAEAHDGYFDTVQITMEDGLRWVTIGFTDTDRAIGETLHTKNTCLERVARQFQA